MHDERPAKPNLDRIKQIKQWHTAAMCVFDEMFKTAQEIWPNEITPSAMRQCAVRILEKPLNGSFAFTGVLRKKLKEALLIQV